MSEFIETALSDIAIGSPGARILVADDDAAMRGCLYDLLSPHWSVETVGNGKDALARALADPPDLVLADVLMPEMTGLALTVALRDDERGRTLPIILLSTRGGEEATVAGLASGADEILAKPFSTNELLARINSRLAMANEHREALARARENAREIDALRRKAEEAARARDQTLAMVSHDLRTPLSNIAMAADVIERVADDKRVSGQANSIRRATGVMDRLINDLLDLSSLDAGRLELEYKPCAPAELVQEAMALFKTQASRARIRLSLDLPPDLPTLICDKDRLLRVFANLISNAIKFTPAGGAIDIRSSAGDDAIRFAVTDTGDGMESEALSHVFQRHWRGEGHNGGGHGLGLAIAKGIVEAHGGRIRAESEPAVGSTFEFSLPLAGASAGSARQWPSTDASRRGNRASVQLRHAFETGGECGRVISEMDWSQTSLGPIGGWPPALRTVVSTILASPYPSAVLWGDDLTLLYNDPLRPLIGFEHHPKALGKPGKVGLPEIAELIGDLFVAMRHVGRGVLHENAPVSLVRQPEALPEETWFNYSYVPVRGESGAIAGTVVLLAETTRHVLAERRMELIGELSRQLAPNDTIAGVYRTVENVLCISPSDIPFALLYQLSGKRATLVASCGVTEEQATRVEDSHWPMTAVLQSDAEQVVELEAGSGTWPGGPWEEPARRAIVLPVAETAVLVVGLSPRLPLDDAYRDFVRHVARQIAAGMAGARRHQEERDRADALARIGEARTTFFSDISHEFRTPLTLILGPVEDAIAAREMLGGSDLDMTRRNALRLYKMVNALLDFSRMETGRPQATFVPTNLSAFTADLASAFRSAAESTGLTFIVDCPPLPEAIYVDPDMWEKVVLNLLSNAVKYTQEGEITVRLRWENECAVLTVADTGIGIAAEDLPNVFRRFFRAGPAYGRGDEGSGVGLALVREWIDFHMGSTDVVSEPGRGSVFTVRLPQGGPHLREGDVESRPRPKASSMSRAAEEAGVRSVIDASTPGEAQAPDEKAVAHILLVDDNSDLRTYLATFLRRFFTRVDTATDGRTALEIARKELPDLVLADVILPDIDGLELARSLRSDASIRAIPIMLLSARADEKSILTGFQSGADDYVVKPFSTRELLARVRAQLDMANLRRSSARTEMESETLRERLFARDEFLSLASHELRTPLTAMRLQAAALIRLAGDNANKAQLEKLNDSIARLTGLVNDVLDVSRITAGRLELQPEPADLVEIVRGAAARLTERNERLQRLVKLSLPDSVVGEWDRNRVEQIVTRLLSNALKHGAGKLLSVGMEANAEWARLWVSDHGPGIPVAEQARIFQRFERAVPANHYGGLGLGLWAARRIAEAMGGSIELKSVEGEGATFTVELPLRR